MDKKTHPQINYLLQIHSNSHLCNTTMMKKDTVWDIVHYKQHRTNSSISQFTHFTGTHHVYSNIISTGRTPRWAHVNLEL